ncbi:MAG: RecX family transcriptional regulator [Actinobacteria bacterium QS_5_72_10]|nr:MAG: RecX family transcriptional regulator [Actinobacteria bacterium QS_5_72_10]
MSNRHARAREALRAAEARTREDDSVAEAREAAQNGDEAVGQALRVLRRSTQHRPRTEAEVAGKLRQRGYGEPIIEQALAAARQQGIVDDAAFATAWVQDRGLKRGFGARRLRDELAGRGVGEADIETALERLDGRDEQHTAWELARTRARQLPADLSYDALVRRLGSYLMRRGHAPSVAEHAAREVARTAEQG